MVIFTLLYSDSLLFSSQFVSVAAFFSFVSGWNRRLIGGRGRFGQLTWSQTFFHWGGLRAVTLIVGVQWFRCGDQCPVEVEWRENAWEALEETDDDSRKIYFIYILIERKTNCVSGETRTSGGRGGNQISRTVINWVMLSFQVNFFEFASDEVLERFPNKLIQLKSSLRSTLKLKMFCGFLRQSSLISSFVR